MILRPDGKPFRWPSTEAFQRALQEACDAAERLAKEQLRIETEMPDRYEEALVQKFLNPPRDELAERRAKLAWDLVLAGPKGKVVW